TVHVRALRLRGLRRVEKPRRATFIRLGFRPSHTLHATVSESVTSYGVALVVSLFSAGLQSPALFVYPCGGVLVENNIRGPTTLLAAEIQLSRGKILELADVVRRRPERSSQLLASRYPRRVHVDCPGPVREDVPSDGFLGEGFAGEDDRLEGGL